MVLTSVLDTSVAYVQTHQNDSDKSNAIAWTLLANVRANIATNPFLKAALRSFISGKDSRTIQAWMIGCSTCPCSGLLGLSSNTAFDTLLGGIHMQHFLKPLFNQCILGLLRSSSLHHFSSSSSTSLSLLSFHVLGPSIGKFFSQVFIVRERGEKAYE